MVIEASRAEREGREPEDRSGFIEDCVRGWLGTADGVVSEAARRDPGYRRGLVDGRRQGLDLAFRLFEARSEVDRLFRERVEQRVEDGAGCLREGAKSYAKVEHVLCRW